MTERQNWQTEIIKVKDSAVGADAKAIIEAIYIATKEIVNHAKQLTSLLHAESLKTK